MTLNGHLTDHKNYTLAFCFSCIVEQPAGTGDVEFLRQEGRMDQSEGFPGFWNSNFTQSVVQEVRMRGLLLGMNTRGARGKRWHFKTL